MLQPLAYAEEAECPGFINALGIKSDAVVFDGDKHFVPFSLEGCRHFMCLRVFDNIHEQLAHRLEQKHAYIPVKGLQFPIVLKFEKDVMLRLYLFSEPLYRRFKPEFIKRGGAQFEGQGFCVPDCFFNKRPDIV